MARMSVDDMVGRDPRVRLLAKALGWTLRETVGCLVIDVWPICYDQMTHLISERAIDAAADREGFTAALIDAELAHRDRSGKVHVAGAKTRIEYLNKKKRSGREGGLKSAESRRKQPKQTSSTEGSTPQARRNPPVPDPVPAPSPALVPDLVLVPDHGASPPARATRARSAKSDDPARSKLRQSVVDAFHEYFVATHAGAKPTWTGKAIGQVGVLVDKHGAHECVRRISVLRETPPKFPPSPWDLSTFVAHFDKLAVAHGGQESALDVALRMANGAEA